MDFLTILGTIYVASSLIATITPSNKDDKFLSKFGRFFDKLGFNPRLLKK